MDVLHTELKEGFFVYLCFCILSLITAEVLTVLVDPSHMYNNHYPPSTTDGPPESQSLDRIMFLLSAAGLMIGLLWSLFHSVLVVKVALRGSLTVSQSSLSILEILFELLFNSHNVDQITGNETLTAYDAITGAFVIIILGIVVPLTFVIIKVFRISPAGEGKQFYGMILHDWSLGDVMALGLFTTLISMNSFDNLSAEAPEGIFSGFYFLLMYGLSCFDLFASFSATDGKVAMRIPMTDALGGEPFSSEDPLLATTPSTATSSSAMLRRRILSKLSGSFLMMKAVGWGVFFFVWFTQAKDNPVDLDKINTALRANLGIINSALAGSLPRTVGNCSDPAALSLTPCVGDAPLYYEKDRYEVEARWVTGINTAYLDAIVLSSPIKEKLALSIAGALDNIPMSLAIGECFTPDVYITGKCDAVWDNTNSCCGSNKRFSISVIAECHEDFPFVRNITINKIKIDPIVISVSIVGFKVNLQDVTSNVTSALGDVLEPYVSEKAFISWGGDKEPALTLADLVNRIIKLNAGGQSAEGKFTCPDPVIDI